MTFWFHGSRTFRRSGSTYKAAFSAICGSCRLCFELLLEGPDLVLEADPGAEEHGASVGHWHEEEEEYDFKHDDGAGVVFANAVAQILIEHN